MNEGHSHSVVTHQACSKQKNSTLGRIEMTKRGKYDLDHFEGHGYLLLVRLRLDDNGHELRDSLNPMKLLKFMDDSMNTRIFMKAYACTVLYVEMRRRGVY